MKRILLGGTLALAATLAACAEPLSTPLAPDSAELAKASGGGTSSLYQLRFIVEDATQGEITSDFFPAGGVKLNTKDPWANLSVSGATWGFNNFTHGTWGAGKCIHDDVRVTWDVAGTSPVRSFAGAWSGTVSFWRNRGMNFYLEAPAADNGGRAIQNIASNHNEAQETRASDKSWFRIRFTNARLGFGGASSPDGNGTLADLAGYEAACANFTVEAVRIQ